MKNDPKVQEMWIKLLEDFNKADVSIKKFCEDNNVKDHQFIYWRNKLIYGKTKSKKNKVNDTDTGFIKVNQVKEVSKPIKLEADGVVLHIDEGFNQSLLINVLKAVKSVD